jgi:hypothetical protein
MKTFVVNFTNNINLRYKLVEHEITDLWSDLISKKTINECCPINHYVGYASDEMIRARIDRLYYLSDLINSRVPNRVIKKQISKESFTNELNIMHVHFPDLKNDSNYQDIWDKLTEYNDIIHWLESTLVSFKKNKNSESSYFRITLDFNKNGGETFLDIPESAYPLFCPFLNFGYLMLHYTHVGRHAHELFLANDYSCPDYQFIPQKLFSASVRMNFTDNFHLAKDKQGQFMFMWKQFYGKRGKHFWKMDLNDPKMAFGYIKLGELYAINDDDNLPKTIEELDSFRKRLARESVLGWTVENY